MGLVFSVLGDMEDLDMCDFGYTAREVMQLVSAAANALLNNLCRRENDKLSHAKNEQKLKTLKA